MAAKPLNSFSQILASLDFPPEDALPEEKGATAAPPPAQDDTIQLSVQARNVLWQKQPETGRNAPAVDRQPEAGAKIDSQGNRTLISRQGTELAASQAAKVAWETSTGLAGAGAEEDGCQG